MSSSNKNLIHPSNKNIIKATTIQNSNQKNSFTRKKFLKYKSFQNNTSEMMNSESSNSSDEDNNINNNINIRFKDRQTGKEDDIISKNIEKNSLAPENFNEGGTLKNKKSSDILFRNASIKHYKKNRPSKIQSEMPLKPFFFFKTEKGKDNKFIKYNKAFINCYAVEKTLSLYSIEENFPKSKNKIAIPHDNLRK